MKCHLHVVGVGAAVLDIVVHVSKFPIPDQKIRPNSTEIHGGGNCANVLSTLSSLGISTSIVTKLGNDFIAKQILNTLKNIDTCHIVTSKMSSSFVYIIVNGDTRTCIHSPAPQVLKSNEVNAFNILNKATFLFLDGRHEEAALSIANCAHEKKIPILLDYEKIRNEELEREKLIPLIDYLVTPEHIPTIFSGLQDILHSMKWILTKYLNLKWMITTLGKNGCILLMRSVNHNLKKVKSFLELQQLFTNVDEMKIEEFSFQKDFIGYYCSARKLKVVDTTGKLL